MYSAGIIVEFNPFHNGHYAHITETRKLTGCKYIIAAMSGNFVQRGEPAICDKWKRTKMALLCGVDVVIEIPMPYVIYGADYFARGSVGLLDATGVVDALCFGSESGNLQEIIEAGHILAKEPAQYKESLRIELDKGLSFAAAKGAALEECLTTTPSEGLLTKPNNGLAIEYCKANILLGEKLTLFTTHRQQGGPSATAIRKALVAGDNVGDFISKEAESILQEICEKNKLAVLDDFSDIFRYLLYIDSKQHLGEGLDNRFRRLCGYHSKISDLLLAVKTKRYTYTRLQRAVLGIMLGISPKDMEIYDQNGGAQYIRILGFRKDAANLVGEITRKAKLPVITHGAAIDKVLQEGGVAAKMLEQELMAGDVYRIATGAGGGYRSERGQRVVVV